MHNCGSVEFKLLDFKKSFIGCIQISTTAGREVASICVVDEKLECIYSTLVKPNNQVLDYNTRLSIVHYLQIMLITLIVNYDIFKVSSSHDSFIYTMQCKLHCQADYVRQSCLGTELLLMAIMIIKQVEIIYNFAKNMDFNDYCCI